ncbi:hypothetical protein H696_01177 [Fonticula alba]|uniref:Uncharacterized protein n=1 Tax=Fonticula alba TaxID=691883 RepID=A0A058ZCU2_FONAL|nr:hypothetical protein H696_01177 [Fonticula alba]KCV71756.1 hypothetical protein H696_01177 [Fonticula alba]|eukprot:XP_009493334.1 hypothetical protein H696_01177 [Fonticula alba]
MADDFMVVVPVGENDCDLIADGTDEAPSEQAADMAPEDDSSGTSSDDLDDVDIIDFPDREPDGQAVAQEETRALEAGAAARDTDDGGATTEGETPSGSPGLRPEPGLPATSPARCCGDVADMYREILANVQQRVSSLQTLLLETADTESRGGAPAALAPAPSSTDLTHDMSQTIDHLERSLRAREAELKAMEDFLAGFRGSGSKKDVIQALADRRAGREEAEALTKRLTEAEEQATELRHQRDVLQDQQAGLVKRLDAATRIVADLGALLQDAERQAA